MDETAEPLSIFYCTRNCHLHAQKKGKKPREVKDLSSPLEGKSWWEWEGGEERRGRGRSRRGRRQEQKAEDGAQ